MPNFTECSEVPRCGLNTRHDNREVTLTHLTQAQIFALWQIGHGLNPHERVNDYQRYSMLIVLPVRSMSCILGNSSSFQAADDDQFCRYFFLLSAKKDELKNFSCMWWWEMLSFYLLNSVEKDLGYQKVSFKALQQPYLFFLILVLVPLTRLTDRNWVRRFVERKHFFHIHLGRRFLCDLPFPHFEGKFMRIINTLI